jgi:hypothetical protein
MTTAMLLVLSGWPARAQSVPAMYSLLPMTISASSRMQPGEFRENRLASERSLLLSQGFQWLTTTHLSRTLHEQPFPVRGQSLSLSSGPQIRLGDTEIVLPFDAGRDTSSLNAESTWTGGTPRMTVAIGPDDRIRLEARHSTRNDALSNRRRRSASISWRHQFNERWALTTGLRRDSEHETMAITSSAEAYASIDATLLGGWRWSLASQLSNASYGSIMPADSARRDRSASLSLSASYPLYGGWWLSGELATRHIRNETERPLLNQSGGVKLLRNF